MYCPKQTVVLQLIFILPNPITDTQWDVTHKKTVFVTKTERNAPFDSGSMSAQNQQMTFRISFGLYPLFGCNFQISNDHLHPCPYEVNGTTTTHIILCYINSNNQYVSYYFYYRIHKPQSKMYVWENTLLT